MRFTKSLQFVLIAFFACLTASAQVDRSIAPQQYKRAKSTDKQDYIENAVQYLVKELQLDGFQEAAVREVYKDYKDRLESLGKDKDMTMAEKKDKTREIMDGIDSRIVPLLSEDQAKRYTELSEKRKKKL